MHYGRNFLAMDKTNWHWTSLMRGWVKGGLSFSPLSLLSISLFLVCYQGQTTEVYNISYFPLGWLGRHRDELPVGLLRPGQDPQAVQVQEAKNEVSRANKNKSNSQSSGKLRVKSQSLTLKVWGMWCSRAMERDFAGCRDWVGRVGVVVVPGGGDGWKPNTLLKAPEIPPQWPRGPNF